MSEKQYVDEVGEGFVTRYEITKKLFSGQSEFQKVEVYETTHYGRMLLNDDLVMVTEKDEFVYHDMITHVPMFLHPKPKKVLIIGGGDGGTAREVLRHASVEKCDMVEIDGMVVDACKEFIPQTAIGMKEDPRFELRIDDGINFVKEAKDKGEKYDVILVDSSEPFGPSEPLFGPEFYSDIHACLADDGIVVSQAESVYYNPEMQKKLFGLVGSQFKHVALLNYSNLTYPGGLWSFCLGSKKLHPVKDFDESRVAASGLEFQYYNAEVHRAAFQLPSFQKQNLQP